MKNNLILKIAKSLSINFGRTLEERKTEIITALKNNEAEIKRLTVKYNSKYEAELFILYEYFKKSDEVFNLDNARSVDIEKDGSVNLPIELNELYNSIYVHSVKYNKPTEKFDKIGDLYLPSGSICILPLLAPHSFQKMDTNFKPGNYGLYIFFNPDVSLLGFEHNLILKLKDSDKVKYWKACQYDSADFINIGSQTTTTAPSTMINLLHGPVLITDNESLSIFKQKASDVKYLLHLVNLKNMADAGDIVSDFINIDDKHNYAVFCSVLEKGFYQSFIGYDDTEEAVCIIFDLHIQYHDEEYLDSIMNMFDIKTFYGL